MREARADGTPPAARTPAAAHRPAAHRRRLVRRRLVRLRLIGRRRRVGQGRPVRRRRLAGGERPACASRLVHGERLVSPARPVHREWLAPAGWLKCRGRGIRRICQSRRIKWNRHIRRIGRGRRIHRGLRRGQARRITRIRAVPRIRRMGGCRRIGRGRVAGRGRRGRVAGRGRRGRVAGRSHQVCGDHGEGPGDRWRACLGEGPGRGRNGRGREHPGLGERARVRDHHRLGRDLQLCFAPLGGHRLRGYSCLRKRCHCPPRRPLLPPRWPTARHCANGCLPLRPGCWQVGGPGEPGISNRKESVRDAVPRSPLTADGAQILRPPGPAAIVPGHPSEPAATRLVRSQPGGSTRSACSRLAAARRPRP